MRIFDGVAVDTPRDRQRVRVFEALRRMDAAWGEDGPYATDTGNPWHRYCLSSDTGNPIYLVRGGRNGPGDVVWDIYGKSMVEPRRIQTTPYVSMCPYCRRTRMMGPWAGDWGQFCQVCAGCRELRRQGRNDIQQWYASHADRTTDYSSGMSSSNSGWSISS